MSMSKYASQADYWEAKYEGARKEALKEAAALCASFSGRAWATFPGDPDAFTICAREILKLIDGQAAGSDGK